MTLPRAAALSPAALVELRSALAAGVSPAMALADVLRRPDGTMSDAGRALQLGTPLTDVAATVASGDATTDLFIRALAVAERTGAGAVDAADRAIEAGRDQAALGRLLQARTAQARGSAAVLSAVPVAVWLLLVLLDSAAIGFYRTAPGVVSGAVAAGLAIGGHGWCRRIVGRARRAVDEPTPEHRSLQPGRMLAAGVPGLVAGWLLAGVAAGLGAGAVAAVLAGRPPRPAAAPLPPGVVAECAQLLAVAVSAGLGAAAATAAVAPFAPADARAALDAAATRLAAGWPVSHAFEALPAIGAIVAAGERWGAPVAPALRQLATDLRADQRAGAEEAAERAQLALVFPTTLLTLPAFVLAVVPPLLWTAFAA